MTRKRMKRWVMSLAITGSTIFGVSCAGQFRDAAAAGVLDFVTGTTTDTLSAVISLDTFFGADEE